jgi:hypothetical protein
MEGFNQRSRGAGGGCSGGGGSPDRRYGGCYGGSRQNDSMLSTFSGVCPRSNPEALHTSVSFWPSAVLASVQRSVSLITHARRIERSATHIQQLQALSLQVHAPQLEGPAHWKVLYPSLNNDSIFLSMLHSAHITKRFYIEVDGKIISLLFSIRPVQKYIKIIAWYFMPYGKKYSRHMPFGRLMGLRHSWFNSLH